MFIPIIKNQSFRINYFNNFLTPTGLQLYIQVLEFFPRIKFPRYKWATRYRFSFEADFNGVSIWILGR